MILIATPSHTRMKRTNAMPLHEVEVTHLRGPVQLRNVICRQRDVEDREIIQRVCRILCARIRVDARGHLPRELDLRVLNKQQRSTAQRCGDIAI